MYFWVCADFGSFETIFRTWWLRYDRQDLWFWKNIVNQHLVVELMQERNTALLFELRRLHSKSWTVQCEISALWAAGAVWLLVIVESYSTRARTALVKQIVRSSNLKRALPFVTVILYADLHSAIAMVLKLNFISKKHSILSVILWKNLARTPPLFLEIHAEFQPCELFTRTRMMCSCRVHWL